MSQRRLRIGQLDWQTTPGHCHVYLWCADDASADAEADVAFSVDEWPVIGPLVERDIKPELADIAGDGEDVVAWFEREKGSLAALYGERLQRVEAWGVHA